MSELAKASCEVCRADSPAADDQQRKQWLLELSEWQIVDYAGMPHLSRTYTFKNFVEAIAFTNRVGEIAEQQDHHPKITTEWGSVNVEWWTHSIGGLHKNDFVMAAKTDLELEV